VRHFEHESHRSTLRRSADGEASKARNLDRIKPSIATSPPPPTTVLGNWYAAALFWKPQLALPVNEVTVLPVLMPLAAFSTLSARFPGELAVALARHGISRAAIDREVAAMTVVRSVLGIMNEFSFLAEACRDDLETSDLLTLSMRLADTPCSPIKHNSPARLVKEIFADG
jgi:hypothetical protein